MTQEQREAEKNMDIRARKSRETSPDRAKVYVHPRLKPSRKVQVVYYLSRNGQLEHPHYMEVCLSANQQLRLKDVMDRLTLLRGKGMPSLYSWSCKRSYKNGYVWNDLAENDIIHPTEGAEYVLKGSELREGCTEIFQHLHVSSKQQVPDPNLLPKRKPLALSRHREPEEVENTRYQEEEQEAEEEEEEKTIFNSSNTPHFRCSRGVSTEEIEETQKNPTELTLDDSPPPPSSTSSTFSEKANETNVNSKRFEQAVEDVGAAAESAPSRNSVLLQFIACGSSVGITRGKSTNVQDLKQPSSSFVTRKGSSSLREGVLWKSAVKVVEEDMMIRCMSENPRFGNLQSEEKQYFSGSIVESMTNEERASVQPVMKRSNSYNEERSTKVGLGEAVEQQKAEKAMKGKCIPRKKSSSSKQTRK
ncbi:hypothetical protein L1049_002908 [Liquidambar formosana]|uniref:SOSEKI DIX-like domain-containing protein n=1 Tax=Liquidambar formosana TaxID=63359 RepID=A0AAP0R7S9_LIQFO